MKSSLRIIDLLIIAVVIGDCVVVVFGGGTNNAATLNYDIKSSEGEKVGIVDQYNYRYINSNGCDESKCISTGISRGIFSCYTDGDRYPMMCADGYKPRIVDNETIIDSYGYQYYFTCCPPDLSSDIDVSRHCSNSTYEDPSNNTMICDDTTKPYPRPMKTGKYSSDGQFSISIESYICCDSNITRNDNDNHTISYLDEIDCVPYNKNYEHYAVHNSYGSIQTASCKEPESGFIFPRFVNNNNTDSHLFSFFECCKTKEGSTPFYQDYYFKITVYPQIAISAIAAISSMVLIIALLVSLLKEKSTQNTNNAGTSTSATTIRPQRTTKPAYSYNSSYNLYLVYLAIPDVMLNLYLLTMYGRYANQKLNPDSYGTIILPGEYLFGEYADVGSGTSFEGAFIVACSTANLYLNCVVFHEILMLLQDNHQVIRCDPPSLLKVTLQAYAVYLFSIIVFIIHYFTGRSRYSSYNGFWSILVTYICPILFIIYVLITIKCRGYMPSATEKMKELVYFFFRIVFIFCLIWLPGMLLVLLGLSNEEGLFIQIGLLFCGLQPIVSTCMAMTKYDVKKYTMDLITLSYNIRDKSSSSTKETRAEANTNDKNEPIDEQEDDIEEGNSNVVRTSS